MQTKTIQRGNVIATVRSAYRRTPILAAQYMAALRVAYPELAEYEIQHGSISLPKVSTTDRKKMTEDDQQKWAEYVLRLGQVNRQFALGAQYANIAELIVPVLARMASITNGAFLVGDNGRLEAAEVVKAFEAYADEENPEDSLWQDMVKAINELDAPLTPAPQQPKEALTDAQRADPLSESSISDGTMKLATIS